MKKVLILHTSVGKGHQTIAENIGVSLKSAGMEVKLADIGRVQSGRFSKIVIGTHQFLNKHLPFVWGFLYRYGHYPILPLRTFIAGFNSHSARKLIADYQPDLIITTQTAASAVVAYLKQQGSYDNLFAIAFSDYHLHPYWLYKQADFYLVNVPEQKSEMIKSGTPADKIFVTCFNLPPASPIDREAVLAKFHVGKNQKVILLGSGSLGLGLDESLLANLSAHKDWQTIVVCGHNDVARQKLAARFNLPNVLVLGFYQPMDELYAIADIFLTKPGGLSVAEALLWNLPMVITSMLPGQEKLNLEYLRRHSLVMPETGDVLSQISAELAGGEFKQSLKNNDAAKRLLAAPHAAEAVAKYL